MNESENRKKIVRKWGVVGYLSNEHGFELNHSSDSSIDEQIKEFMGLE